MFRTASWDGRATAATIITITAFSTALVIAAAASASAEATAGQPLTRSPGEVVGHRVAPLSGPAANRTATVGNAAVLQGPEVSNEAPQQNGLVGSWLETVTFPPEAGRPPLKSLVVFHADHTTITSDQGSVTQDPPTVFSVGAGSWKHLEGRRFAYTILELISDLSGNLVGYLKVRGVYTVAESGNEYSGTSFAQVLDTAGNVLFAVDVTNAGKRIQVDLP